MERELAAPAVRLRLLALCLWALRLGAARAASRRGRHGPAPASGARDERARCSAGSRLLVAESLDLAVFGRARDVHHDRRAAFSALGRAPRRRARSHLSVRLFLAATTARAVA